MKIERKPLIHHIIDLLKAVTNYLAYRFTGHAIEWENNVKERTKQTMILKGALDAQKEMEEIDEEELLGI
jgi:hypothetical protein